MQSPQNEIHKECARAYCNTTRSARWRKPHVRKPAALRKNLPIGRRLPCPKQQSVCLRERMRSYKRRHPTRSSRCGKRRRVRGREHELVSAKNRQAAQRRAISIVRTLARRAALAQREGIQNVARSTQRGFLREIAIRTSRNSCLFYKLLSMAPPREKYNGLGHFETCLHHVARKHVPAEFGMAGRRMLSNGERGVQQQHTLFRPWREVARFRHIAPQIGGHLFIYVAQARRQFFADGHGKREAHCLIGPMVRVLTQNHHANIARGTRRKRVQNIALWWINHLFSAHFFNTRE